MNLMGKDSIGFDLDGTLWDGTGAIENAWKGFMTPDKDIIEVPNVEQLKGVMGLPLPKIMQKLFPYLTAHKHNELIKQCIIEETKYIKAHGGRLFEDLEPVLFELSQQYKLYIVSNCQSGYIEAFLEHYGFEKYFCDFECIGNTSLSKGENIRLVMKRNNFSNTVFIGDTQGDYDAALNAGVDFVFAQYGFGSIDNSKVPEIDKVSDLLR